MSVKPLLEPLAKIQQPAALDIHLNLTIADLDAGQLHLARLLLEALRLGFLFRLQLRSCFLALVAKLGQSPAFLFKVGGELRFLLLERCLALFQPAFLFDERHLLSGDCGRLDP